MQFSRVLGNQTHRLHHRRVSGRPGRGSRPSAVIAAAVLPGRPPASAPGAVLAALCGHHTDVPARLMPAATNLEALPGQDGRVAGSKIQILTAGRRVDSNLSRAFGCHCRPDSCSRPQARPSMASRPSRCCRRHSGPGPDSLPGCNARFWASEGEGS